ncbi:MAG: division plane positioning ATPase MipZ [Gammaproteobacteria bacterium]|nr:division plane positioning ATPase MipZ [Gammaproteobacteria bacterium]
MITIIGNLKGGTGKSTVAFNLAIWLKIHQGSVTLFDLDPQKTLSDVVDIRDEEGYEPELEVFDDVDALKAWKNKKSEVIVDVGTSDFDAMKTALKLADRIITPVPPSQADIWSTQRFIKLIREETGGTKKMPPVFGFINRADTHRGVRETDEAEEALEYLKSITRVDLRLYQRTAYRRSFSEGLAVFEMQPSSKASKEILSLAKILYTN